MKFFRVILMVSVLFLTSCEKDNPTAPEEFPAPYSLTGNYRILSRAESYEVTLSWQYGDLGSIDGFEIQFGRSSFRNLTYTCRTRSYRYTTVNYPHGLYYRVRACRRDEYSLFSNTISL